MEDVQNRPRDNSEPQQKVSGGGPRGPDLDCEARIGFITDCCICGDPVHFTCIRHGGVLSDPSYTLVADWVVHSVCWDRLVEERGFD